MAMLGVEWKILTPKALQQYVPDSRLTSQKLTAICDMVTVDFSPEHPMIEKRLNLLGLGDFANVPVEARRRAARLQLSLGYTKKMEVYSERSDFLTGEIKAEIDLTKQCPAIYGAGFNLAAVIGALAMEGRRGIAYVPRRMTVCAPLNIWQWT